MSQPFYLSLFIGPGHPLPAQKDLIEALMSVEVKHSTTGQGGCQLVFTVGKESRINRVLLPAGFFDYKTRVRVVVTVAGKATPIFEGIITRHDLAPGNQAAKATLTLSCLDLTALMDFVDLTGSPLPPAPTFALVNLVVRARSRARNRPPRGPHIGDVCSQSARGNQSPRGDGQQLPSVAC